MAPTLLNTQLHWAMQEAACELLSDLDFVDSFVAENCKRLGAAYDFVTGVQHGLRPEATLPKCTPLANEKLAPCCMLVLGLLASTTDAGHRGLVDAVLYYIIMMDTGSRSQQR